MGKRVGRVDRQSGQSLIMFTLMLTAFIGFCALVVDVGRAYAERRYMQNASDAGVLAAGGLIASSLMPCDDNTRGVCTDVRKGEVVARAVAAATANASLLGGYTQPIDVVVRYKRYDFAHGRCDTSAWSAADAINQNDPIVMADKMPPDACKLRVEATSHWTTWFPLPTGPGASLAQRAGAAGASAVAMVVGDNSLTPRGDVWPMVRRRSALDPTTQDPTRAYPFQFWSSSAANHLDDAGNNWKELVNLGYNSLRPGAGSPGYSLYAAPRIQAIQSAELARNGLLDGWRDGQSWFPLSLVNKSGNGGVYWSPKANNGNVSYPYMYAAYQQDVENWFDYGFGGKLSLLKDWSGYSCSTPGLPCNLPSAYDFQHGLSIPSVANINYDLSVLGSNSSTLNAPWWRAQGDWVETYNGQGYGSGDIGNNVHDKIVEYIARNGRDDCMFSQQWGRCVDIAVYLWEGAQMYYPMGTGSDFTYWIPWSGLHGNKANGAGVPDRVHLVDFWYFQFYEGIANIYPTSEIDGFFVAKGEVGKPPSFNTAPSSRLNYYFLVGE